MSVKATITALILDATAAGRSMLTAANAAAQRVLLSLGNVDNTSDVNKPVSTAQQTALDLKAPIESPTLTGTPLAPTATGGTNTTQIATTAFVAAGFQPLDADLTAIAALADPNADRILFWDDSLGAYTYLTVGSGLTITDTTLSASGGSGITTLNTLTGATQTFAVGTSGTDFAIVSSGTSHTWNLPDASAVNRGVITIGTQTIAGAKTFSSNVSILTSSAAALFTVTSTSNTSTAGWQLDAKNGGGTNSSMSLSFSGSTGIATLAYPSGSIVFDSQSGTARISTTGTLYVMGSSAISLGVSTSDRVELANTAFRVRVGTVSLGQMSGSSNWSFQDLNLNGKIYVHTTYTSATVYERLNVKGVAAANFEIGPENGSAGGTLRGLTIGGYTAGSSTITPWLTFANTGLISYPTTVTAGGTTGNQTINKLTGTVNIAAAGTTVTVTNSLVSANSLVFVELRTNDATATIKNVVPAAGSFVINLGAAATAEVSIGFLVIN